MIINCIFIVCFLLNGITINYTNVFIVVCYIVILSASLFSLDGVKKEKEKRSRWSDVERALMSQAPPPTNQTTAFKNVVCQPVAENCLINYSWHANVVPPHAGWRRRKTYWKRVKIVTMATAIYLEHYLDSEYNSLPNKYSGFNGFFNAGLRCFNRSRLRMFWWLMSD